MPASHFGSHFRRGASDATAGSHTGRTLGRVLLDYPANSTGLAPSIQSLPSTVAAANALSGATFSDVWLCTAASGNLVSAGGATLTAGGGTNRYAKTVPQWNGTDYTSGYRAIEFLGTDATPQSFAAADGAAYGLSQSVTWVMAVRLARGPGGTRGIFGCKSASTAAGAGYCLQVATTGNPACVISDGSTSATAQGPAITAEQDTLANGSIQWLAVKMDVTSGDATVFAYRDTGTPVAMPGGTKTSATVWRLGGQPYLFSCELMQVLWMGVLLGANAEAFTLTHLNAMDNVCRVPSALTGHVRYSCLAPVVGSDATGVRAQMLAGSTTTTSKIDFAHAYAAACTATGGIGILCERGTEGAGTVARRNRLLNTGNLASASFTLSSVTATANHADDPFGFHGAARLTATGANGTIVQNCTGVASTEHTVSVFARRVTGTGTVRLALYDSSGPTEIAGADITLTSTWQRFSVAGTPGALTTLQWRITIATSGDAIHATGAQLEYKWLGSYQPQVGALVARDDIEFYVDNSTGQAFDSVGGRVEMTCTGLVATVDSTGCYVVASNGGASDEDRWVIQRDALPSTHDHDSQHRDSAGALVSQIQRDAATNTDEITYAHEWDSRYVLTGEQVRVFDDVGGTRWRSDAAAATPATEAWTTGANATRLMLGMRHTFTAHLEGIVTALRTWGRVP